MQKGKVKIFYDTKGYGFITPDLLSADLFFHVSDVAGDIEVSENDRVSFDVEIGRKGQTAVNVKLI